MDEVGSVFAALIGMLFGLAILAAVFIGLPIAGYMLFTSSAVLFSERQEPQSNWFTCRYFTGTRVFEQTTFAGPGCSRFIEIRNTGP